MHKEQLCRAEVLDGDKFFAPAAASSGASSCNSSCEIDCVC